MAIYITVDGGTTNTRLSLVSAGDVVDTVKYAVGAAMGREAVERAVSDGVSALLSKNGVAPIEVDSVIASGMITSEGGMYNLPHVSSPAGLDELAEGVFETRSPLFPEIPLAFVRGVRINSGTLSTLDMMRGEETEIMGIGDCAPNTLYIFPGSHMKHILTDSNSRIYDSKTTLTGEMISAVARDTILKNSVSLGACQVNFEYLAMGYELSRDVGLSFALFKARVLDKLMGASPEEVYSFYIGAMLECDISIASRSEAECVTVGGKRELREPIVHLLRKYSDKSVCELADEDAALATVRGAIKIYEERRRMENGKAL